MKTKKPCKKVYYCKFLDVNTDQPDKKSILMYITTMYEVLGGQKDFMAEGDGSEIEQQVLYLFSLFCSLFYLMLHGASRMESSFATWKITCAGNAHRELLLKI